MATPMKISSHVIIPMLEKCVACSEESKLKYPIINKSGERCSSYEIVSNFYEASFDCLENHGSYLCKGCHRLLSRILDSWEKTDKLADCVLSKSQSLQSATRKKSVIRLTPNEKKRYRPVKSPPTHSFKSPTKLTPCKKQTHDSIAGKKSRIALFKDHNDGQLPVNFTTKEFPVPLVTYCDKTTQTDRVIDVRKKNNIYHQNSRHAYIVYRSVNTKSDLSKTVRYLSNGSIRLGVKSLLEHKKREIQQQCLLAIQDISRKECTEFAKKPSTLKMNITDIHSFDITNVAQYFQNNTEVLWTVLCSSASNKKGIIDTAKVCMAAAVLFNSRSVKLNAFQHVIGISMYNNQLQKDGFLILSKLGITPSHVTVNSALNKMKNHVEHQLDEWKASLECATSHQRRPVTDHSYARNAVCSDDQQLLDHDYLPSQPSVNNADHSLNHGYRFNIDNLDFLIHARNMTQDRQNQSKHYVQLMAINDRVNCEHFINDRPLGNLSEVPYQDFIPNGDDNYSLRKDIVQVVAQIIVENLDSFSTFNDVIEKRFQHQFSEEMKQKSVVLPLGILPKNENITNDMIDILKHVQKFVPNARSEQEIEEENFRDDSTASMRCIPIGGDQLTCERIRGAHMARLDGDTPEERLEGVFCMVEDFHEKMNFLQVIMDKYFKAASCREAGTLFQLKNVLNRRNVVKQVSADYHAVGDFIDLITEGHVIAAVLEYCKMKDFASKCQKLPKGIHIADKETKKRILLHLVGEIVDIYFLNQITINVDRLDDQNLQREDVPNEDKIYFYACNLAKLGLLRKVSVLATRYGDGDRILRHWKYGMLLYHQAHKTKYRLESFLLLAGVNALYTPCQRHQVIHNRFVNLSGGEGNNLDGDYVMELLNRFAKSRIHLLGPNHSSNIVDRIGKTIMLCHDIQDKLEKQIHVAPVSRDHTSPSLLNDRKTVVQELLKAKVFQFHPGRCHESFSNENMDIFSNIDVKEFHKWIISKKKEYSVGKCAF